MSRQPIQSQFAWAVLQLLLAGLLGCLWAFHWDLLLHDPVLGEAGLLSELLRGRLAARLSFSRLVLPGVFGAPALWALTAVAARLSGLADSFWSALRIGTRAVLPLVAYATFDSLWLFSRLAGTVGLQAGLLLVLPTLHQLVPAAILATLLWAAAARWLRAARGRSALALVAIASLAYGITFATLSVLQYQALMVPHGDTAMYEEHLWNLLNGKGFRSQLDGGRLFLGEHIEFIHVFLIPVYVLKPSLPTLNVVYSFALAAGGLATYALARSVGLAAAPAALLAVAYLLYPPLQYLNLEASLKTFRPENLAVPLVLAALWAVETRRAGWFIALLALALTAKEDYAILYTGIGLFLLAAPGSPRKWRLLGGAVAVASVAYLWFVLKVAIPWFRGGPPHYLAYYPSLGQTPGEVVATMVDRPWTVVRLLLDPANAALLLGLLAPLGFAPLLAPATLAAALPSAAPLLLGELPGLKQPIFHFHAPLVPVLFWAAARGLKGLSRAVQPSGRPCWWPCFVACAALASGFWQGKSPLSLAFYDPGSDLGGYWRRLYVPGERVRRFEQLYRLVPRTASVAATDYVRPRFTHHRACHEIGSNGLKPHVRPEEVDYLVIDLRGPYSDPVAGLRVPLNVRHPRGWETVYRDEFFLVTRARSAEPAPEPSRPTHGAIDSPAGQDQNQ